MHNLGFVVHTKYTDRMLTTHPCCHVHQINDDCDVNNDAESAAAFFAGMCTPGAPTAVGANGNDAIADTLCSSCKPASVQGQDFCVKGADTYQGYDGALTCLEEGDGDVAFIKHTTIQGAPISIPEAVTPPYLSGLW